MTSKRILMLTTKYGGPGQSPYLSNELASAFRARGHEVQVVSVEWARPRGAPLAYREPDGVRVLLLAPWRIDGLGRFVVRLSKWVCASGRAARDAQRALEGQSFDYVFAFAPATPLRGLVRWSRRFRAPGFLYITDFFPFAARSLKQLPGGPLFAFALRTEARLMAGFDVLGCMSPANRVFLEAHYPVGQQQRIALLPIWGPTDQVASPDRAAARTVHGLPVGIPIAVFGGQLVEGRGIEEILDAARIAAARGLAIHFALIGSGRLEATVRREIEAGAPNLTWLGQISREAYLPLVAACDVGLVVTTPNTGVPTFPSKTIDYLRAGLPIVASVEDTTDYGDFIAGRGIGVAVAAGSGERLLDAVLTLTADPPARDRYRAAGGHALREVFDVNLAAKRVLTALAGAD